MARLAVISDIHGELARLRSVLADIAARGADRIMCLGDSVDERPGGAPVLAELLTRNIPSVLGNCDRLCELSPGSPEDRFVGGMPLHHVEDGVLFTHISPVRGGRGLRQVPDAARIFAEVPHRLCFTGHIHIPAIFSDTPEGHARSVPFEYGEPVALDPARRYAVCVGAVGRGRDGVEEPRYAIFDSATQTVEIVLVPPGGT